LPVISNFTLAVINLAVTMITDVNVVKAVIANLTIAVISAVSAVVANFFLF
jgi:hypothetical protein